MLLSHPKERERIVLVMDNLNTHHPSSLYETFEAEEAQRIARRLQIHCTPKHGSWLNMAEPESAVLARQCLDRRIPDQELLGKETKAWQDQRNQGGRTRVLAFHRPGRSHKTEVSIPITSILLNH